MPETVRLPNSAHVWSHSSAALPRESESSGAHTGGKPLAPEIVLREGRLAGELGLSSWADGGCPTGVLWGAPWWGPEAEGERERERAGPGEGEGSGGQAAERGDRLCVGGCVPRGRCPWVTAGILGLGQLSGWVEGGAAGPEGAWWGLSSAVLTRGAGGRGARGQCREGQPEALLPGPPETGQVGGCRPGPLGTRGRVSGPTGRRWVFPPLVRGSVRPTTSGLSGLHALLLKWERGHTVSSPLLFHQKAGWGCTSREALLSSGHRQGGGLKQGLSCTGSQGVWGWRGGLIQGDRRLGPQGVSCRAPAWQPPPHP